MIELIQFPWSPYCLVLGRILEYSGKPHRRTNLPPSDRSLVWRLTKERYYQVPVVREGRTVLFETDPNSQVIAKYLNQRLELDLFPRNLDGVQKILWRYIENDVEDMTFRLNDAYYREFVPRSDQCLYVRHKERKFGTGCLDRWKADQKELAAELARRLLPFEQMVCDKPYLLDLEPRFVDFDLWGMLANIFYSGHYRIPAAHTRMKRRYARMSVRCGTTRIRITI
jgi:glutathione S-transferase